MIGIGINEKKNTHNSISEYVEKIVFYSSNKQKLEVIKNIT